MIDAPKRPPGRPRVADPLVSVSVKIRRSVLDRIDRERGETPRGEWLLASLRAREGVG